MIVKHKITSPTIAKETCRALYAQMQEVPFLEEASYKCLKDSIRHIELQKQGVPQITKRTVKDLKLLWDFLRYESEFEKIKRDMPLATLRNWQAKAISRIGVYIRDL